ncbi:MAG: hypothetical protein U0Q10_05395 [Dermatophilaceae bacterium]
MRRGSFIAAYRTEAERETLLEEMTQHQGGRPGHPLRRAHRGPGPRDRARLVPRDRRRAAPARPALCQPRAYVNALADSVRARGARLEIATPCADRPGPGRYVGDHRTRRDRAVRCGRHRDGAWPGLLARDFGVKKVVQAGRGYSFSVAMGRVPNGPVYFPAARVACTWSATGCASPG